MSTNDKELLDLLARFSLSEGQLRTALDDIRRGDDLINQHDRVEVERAVLSQVKARVRRELARTARRQVGFSWPLRAAAIAAALLVVLGLTIYWLQPQGIGARGTGLGGLRLVELSAGDYLRVAWQEDVVNREIDDMVFTEVLDHWSAVNWDMDDIFGPGTDEEVDSVDSIAISHGERIGPWIC